MNSHTQGRQQIASPAFLISSLQSPSDLISGYLHYRTQALSTFKTAFAISCCTSTYTNFGFTARGSFAFISSFLVMQLFLPPPPAISLISSRITQISEGLMQLSLTTAGSQVVSVPGFNIGVCAAEVSAGGRSPGGPSAGRHLPPPWRLPWLWHDQRSSTMALYHRIFFDASQTRIGETNWSLTTHPSKISVERLE